MFVILRVVKQFTDHMKHIDYAGGEKSMGFYLNSVLPYKRYEKMSATSYFVDKHILGSDSNVVNLSST